MRGFFDAHHLLPGDILLTRNPEGSNPTPGYWNHAAIVALDRPAVVEIQRDLPDVAAFELNAFLRRYPEWIALAPKDGPAAADVAAGEVGRPNTFVCLPNRPRDPFPADFGRDNCISFLRRCFLRATGRDYRWITPDNVLLDGFRVLDRQKTRNWQPPADRYGGRIKPNEI